MLLEYDPNDFPDPWEERRRDQMVYKLQEQGLVDADAAAQLLIMGFEDAWDKISYYLSRKKMVDKYVDQKLLTRKQARAILKREDPEEGYEWFYFTLFRVDFVRLALESHMISSHEADNLLAITNPREGYDFAVKTWWLGTINQLLGKKELTKSQSKILQSMDPSQDSLKRLKKFLQKKS